MNDLKKAYRMTMLIGLWIEVTHGEKEIRRSVGIACGTLSSLNRETPTTVATAI